MHMVWCHGTEFGIAIGADCGAGSGRSAIKLSARNNATTKCILENLVESAFLKKHSNRYLRFYVVYI